MAPPFSTTAWTHASRLSCCNAQQLPRQQRSVGIRVRSTLVSLVSACHEKLLVGRACDDERGSAVEAC
eukprot:9707917-Prorocentrum_lima.AAC.1